MTPESLEGGCLCGALRYRAEGPIGGAAHCHCHLCRRASGAVVLTWFWLARERFRITRGRLATYRSSAHGERGFCGRCGTQITFTTDEQPADIDVTLGSLDAPERLRPTHHIWVASRVSWLHLDESLPDHPQGSPD